MVQPASALAPPAASSVAPSEPLAPLQVHLVPIGRVRAETVAQAAEGLHKHAGVEPVVHESQPPPSSARSPRPGALQATVLLQWLEALPLPPQGKIMGIAEADIVAPTGSIPIWGVLGLGSLRGHSSVISTYRMKRRWEKGGASEALVRERLWKIAVHELGHTLGLEHCEQPGCLMEDGRGTVKTIDRDTALCPACEQKYAARIRLLQLRAQADQ